MIDHQLSPLMMHRTLPDEDILNSSFTSSVHLKNSTISHSPPPSVSPSHSSPSSSDIGSPVECYEDKIDIGSCQNNVVKDTQPVQTFQSKSFYCNTYLSLFLESISKMFVLFECFVS